MQKYFKKSSLIVILVKNIKFPVVAEVLSEVPLTVKIKDNGEGSLIRQPNFVIHDTATQAFLGNDQNKLNEVLQKALNTGSPIVTALKHFNVIDGEYHKLHPNT